MFTDDIRGMTAIWLHQLSTAQVQQLQRVPIWYSFPFWSIACLLREDEISGLDFDKFFFSKEIIGALPPMLRAFSIVEWNTKASVTKMKKNVDRNAL